MPLAALALLLLLPLALIALMPVILLQRYRVGSARRLARPWLASINLVAMFTSAAFFLFVSAATTMWVPDALSSAVLGLAVGLALGVFGLWLTRWEATPRTLHYTPNRWLVLAVTMVVAARVLYGFWRGWTSWQSIGSDTSWVATFGLAGSLGAGATVVGYYLSYAIGLRRRISRWQKRALRPMG